MVSGWGTRMHSRIQTFLENGTESYSQVSEELGQKAERGIERKRNSWPYAPRKDFTSAGAVDTGLTQSRQKEAGDSLTTLQKPASCRQTSSRAGILPGQRRVCKNPNHGDFLAFLALPRKPHNH